MRKTNTGPSRESELRAQACIQLAQLLIREIQDIGWEESKSWTAEQLDAAQAMELELRPVAAGAARAWRASIGGSAIDVLCKLPSCPV